MQRRIYDEDHDAFRAAVREFVAREVEPRVDQSLTDKSLDRELWLAAGGQGLLGLEIPEAYGGAEAGDFRFNAVLIEELAAVNMALPTCFSIHSDIAIPYLVHLGTDEQKQRWLPGAASGDLLMGIAMTEPSGGSDLAALKTSAVRDGDGWRVNGSKTFITNGFSGDLFVTPVRTGPDPGAKGISLFVLEAAADGFVRGRKLDKAGQDEADTSELFFDDLHVSDDQRLGNLGEGFITMMNWLPQERLAISIGCIAHAAQILRETVVYCQERTAFGQSVGSFQHNKFLLAELVTKIEVSQAYVDQAVEAHTRGALTAVDAAKLKWWTSAVQNEVLDHCVQLYGGYGYMNEYRVTRAWRDARVTKIWAGSNEIMKELIGRDLGF